MEILEAANNAKQQYRQQKPTFLKLVNENEKLQEELKRKQKQLLKVNLDKYFLFERLLSYEKPPPRKYTKQNKTKPLPGSDTVSADDPSSQNEMSISTPPKTSNKKMQKHKPVKRKEEEESLEVEVDMEEDNEQVSDGMSLLKQTTACLGVQQKEQKSHERKKYKKRRKSTQNADEKGQTSSSLLGSQILPGGTSLLLSSFSAQSPSKS